MPKKGGRKPSARKAQSQAALSRVIVKHHESSSSAGLPQKTELEKAADVADASEPEPEPELQPGETPGDAGERADELELIRAMFEEELTIPALDDPYTFSLRLSVPDSAQRLRSWTAPLLLDVVLPARGYPQATQLRVRCARCDKRALRSLHRAMAIALADDHSVGDHGPRVCFAAQWLVDHGHRFFNVAEVARNPPRQAAAEATALKSGLPVSTKRRAEEEPEDGGEDEDADGDRDEDEAKAGHGVDLCFCVFESLRASLPVDAPDRVITGASGDNESDGSWIDEDGRLRRHGGATKHAAAALAAAGGNTSVLTTAPVGKLLAQWARKKYFIGLLLRGAPAVVVLQTNVAPE